MRMNLLSMFFLLALILSFGFSPIAVGHIDKVTTSVLTAPPPFRAMANNDGLPGNQLACIETQHTAWQLVLISNSIPVAYRKDYPEVECQWPLYVYAYLGNDFDHALGISEALEFGPSALHPDIYETGADVDLDFRPYLNELCTGGATAEVHYSLALVYLDGQGNPQLVPQCDTFFPQDLFVPNSFVTSHKRLLACEGPCSAPPDNPMPEADMLNRRDKTRSETHSITENPIGRNVEEEQALEQMIRVSPNPFSAFLNIRLPEQERNIKIKLRDMNGKLWLEKNISSGTTSPNVTLSTAQLPLGLYILTVQSADSIKSYKMLKAYPH